MLEEWSGLDEDDKYVTDYNASPERIYFNSNISDVINRLQNDSGTKMQLLGTTMSLVGLRHELSFVLKIDDPAFASKMTGNYESKAAIHMVDIENL